MTKKRVLIFGGTGMLGRVFFETQKDFFEIILLSRSSADITIFPLVLDQISLHNPDIILNFAAFTDVEGSEGEGMMEAFSVNALGAQNIAKAAGAFGIQLIHISTDYVFDGEKEGGYIPVDIPHPINSYGMSKYLGEELIRREYSLTIIVRTSALYGGPLFGNPGVKKHFINALLERSTIKPSLKIVSDAFTVPTSCQDLSNALRVLIESIEKYEEETLHFVSENMSGKPVSWQDFALEIKKYIPSLGNIEPISSIDYITAVKRPKYGILKNTSEILLPDWKISLKNYLNRE